MTPPPSPFYEVPIHLFFRPFFLAKKRDDFEGCLKGVDMNITLPGYCISGFLCRAFLRGCAEILVVGEIFTSGASEPPRSKKNQIIEGQ